MNLIIQLAFRNIFRRKFRSFLIIVTMAIGVSGIILANSLNQGVIDGWVNNAVRLDLGHINIQAAGFKEKKFLSLNITYQTELLKNIQALPGILALAPRIRSQGMAATAEYSAGIQIVGINPSLEKKLTVTSQKIITGNYLDQDPHQIILGQSLAEKLHVTLDDKVILMSQDLNNAIGSAAFRVRGIFNSGSPEYDKYTVFITLPAAQEMLAMPDKISQISILLSSDKLLTQVQTQIKKLLHNPKIDVLSWKEIMPILVIYQKMMAWASAINFLIIFICVAVVAANIMLMAVFERIHEFGILKAIGNSSKNIFQLIMLESLLLGILGLLIGLFIGYAAILYFIQHPIDLAGFASGASLAGMDTKLYPTLSIDQSLWACAAVLLTCVLSALYPAFKASRLKPVEALRYL